MSDSIWFYVRNGVQQGPVAIEQLQTLVGPADLVWKDGMTDWLPAGRISAIGLMSRATPPMAPQMPLHGMPPGMYPPGGGPKPMGYNAPGFRQPADPNDIGQNAGMRMLLPVGRSGWAIAAGYLGLFSVLVCPAPIAVIISVIAILDIRTHPDRHGMGRAIFGLVMGIIFSIGLVILVAVGALTRH